MTAVNVTCAEDDPDAWICTVRLSDLGHPISQHRVRVFQADLRRLHPGATEPTDLVRRSFRFLLRREPPSMILQAFDLVEIGRYFPEYETEIASSP
jgi:hypothetical protein